MTSNKTWEVDIYLDGPISISRSISFKQKKGFNKDQFHSNIVLHATKHGVKATITAIAKSSKTAQIAAYVFVG